MKPDTHSFFCLGALTVLLMSPLQAQDRYPPPGQIQSAGNRPQMRLAPQQQRQSAFPSQRLPSGAPNAPVEQSRQGTPPFQQQQFQQQSRQQGQQQQPRGQPGFTPLVREMEDFGIPAISQLHTGQMHGPTPTSIPGGKVTTTAELSAALQQNNSGWLVFHVLGGQEYLPNAQYAAPASAAGSFNDQTQQRFAQYLGQVTQGRKNTPLVFYCASPQCWMSYNAALRAINDGFTNVLWYRGGLAAWKAAGLPTQTPRQPPAR